MDPVLPGEDLIEEGVNDLRAQRETIPALLVAIGLTAAAPTGNQTA